MISNQPLREKFIILGFYAASSGKFLPRRARFSATSRRKPEITQPLHVSAPECHTEGIHLKKGTQAHHATPGIDRPHSCH